MAPGKATADPVTSCDELPIGLGRTTRSARSCATLCYMSEGDPSRVGVRELRQNLSIYLDRVKDGESLEVTERGHVVARLSPSEEGSSTYEQMVNDGRINPGKGGLASLGPPPSGSRRPLSDVLRELRDDEID